MPFHIIRNDITAMAVDAIVNAADPSLLGGGGVDGAIHAAAGPELLEECRSLDGCRVGQAKITGGYRLPCRYVIHTVGPRWQGGLNGEGEQLACCYRSSLSLAKERGCESVAFPLIAAGTFGFPRDRATRIAVDTIGEFLLEHDMTVYLVLYGQESLAIGKKLSADIQEYISDRYVQEHAPLYNRPSRRREQAAFREDSVPAAPAPRPSASPARPKASGSAAIRQGLAYGALADSSLDRELDDLDESFQQMLLRKIDESGMTDAQCYKKANIDRKLFSKIRKDVHYRPSKQTALAFAVALELDLTETSRLLERAGFALSRSSKFDVIIRYFIEHGNYNIFEINEALFFYDQSLLGA